MAQRHSIHKHTDTGTEYITRLTTGKITGQGHTAHGALPATAAAYVREDRCARTAASLPLVSSSNSNTRLSGGNSRHMGAAIISLYGMCSMNSPGCGEEDRSTTNQYLACNDSVERTARACVSGRRHSLPRAIKSGHTPRCPPGRRCHARRPPSCARAT